MKKILFLFTLVLLAGVISVNEIFAQYMGNVGSQKTPPEPLTDDEEYEKIIKESMGKILHRYTSGEIQPPAIEEFGKLDQLSSKAMELYNSKNIVSNIILPTKSDFCKIIESPYLTSNDKKIFLEICNEYSEWFDNIYKEFLAKVDQGVINAEKMINEMDVSDEQKSIYISKTKSDGETLKNNLAPQIKQLEQSKLFLKSNSNIQPSIPIASFVDITKDPQYYVDRYNNEPKYKKWFDTNFPEYTSIYQAVGMTEKDYQNNTVNKSQPNEPICNNGEELINGKCVLPEPKSINEYPLLGSDSKSTAICGDGTKLENGKCVIDKQPKSTTDSKQGLWIKYKLNIDIHTGNYLKPENNDQMLKEHFMNSYFTNLPSTIWSYMNPEDLDFVTVEHTQFTDVVITNNYATTKDGHEFFLGTITSDKKDYALDFKNRNVGETIKAFEGMYMEIVDFKKMYFGEKQVDVVILERHDESTLGFIKFQSIYHKNTGILLSMVLEITGSAYTPEDRLNVSWTAIEISDAFEKRITESLGGGCLIATATYGSELAPQVQQLREIRDNSLLQTASGTNFMSGFNQFYYLFSPTIADWERESPVFKEIVKIAITPMISSLSILNYVDMDSEVSVLGYGISLILLNVGMYFVAPTVIVVGIRKRF